MLNKKIYRYSNVELLDLVKNEQNESLVNEAELEWKNRNLTKAKIKQVELDYIKYKEFQNKRTNTPLTDAEWISFFFLPLFTPKPRWREDHYSESEIERFKKYGFNKKIKQAEKVRTFGYLFWFLIILVSVLLVTYLKK